MRVGVGPLFLALTNPIATVMAAYGDIGTATSARPLSPPPPASIRTLTAPVRATISHPIRWASVSSHSPISAPKFTAFGLAASGIAAPGVTCKIYTDFRCTRSVLETIDSNGNGTLGRPNNSNGQGRGGAICVVSAGCRVAWLMI
ncbi:hypothetical protein N658DRAFT_527111 [Parathielavia hyrcaniae]|uniref:Uncharacterized protein n=1 Tax=Parathielavia hyrcaniae TaxID=113614 RepID=A0AAN6PTA3_9PEZI|nr:hypothetical protein N658DRAFT_527111 [Parathielavia hyrcaniae]